MHIAVYKMACVCSRGGIVFTVTNSVESVLFWLTSFSNRLTLRTVSSFVQKGMSKFT